MVRNRPINWFITNRQQLVNKFLNIILISSAVMVWLIIIIAVSYLMINNKSLKEAVKDHVRRDQETQCVRKELRDDMTEIDRRLKALEKHRENGS